jgi:hypothetical protein
LTDPFALSGVSSVIGVLAVASSAVDRAGPSVHPPSCAASTMAPRGAPRPNSSPLQPNECSML